MKKIVDKIIIDKHVIELNHQDKNLFGFPPISKGEIINYYTIVAPIMMPHLINRPIAMKRFPEGIMSEGFFQKDASDYFPRWIKRFPIKKKNSDVVNYVVINTPATLIYIANQACITPHLWLSRIDKINKPDRIIFDLDPCSTTKFSDVQYVAKELKSLLDELSLPSFCMLTGSRGVHVVIPIKRLYTYDQTHLFAHNVACVLEKRLTDIVTTSLNKKSRESKIFIDWLRNSFGATSVAPYAIRAQKNAPIAMPITWDKLYLVETTSQSYTIKNALEHIKKNGDAWATIQQNKVSLTQAFKAIQLINL